MPSLRTELRQAITAYKSYLETGERRQQMEYKTVMDPQVGESYLPIGYIECILIRGPDAVEPLQPLRQRLREAAEAAYEDEALRAAADALTTGIPFLPVGTDMSVNRTNMMDVHDPVTDKKRPFCEYVRPNVLDALNRALKRLELAAGGELQSAGTPEAASKASRQNRYEWLAHAMLLVKEHPNYSDRKIAKTVSIDPAQLTRSPEYQTAAALARGQKQAIPRGSKDGITGELEAEAEAREID